MSGLDPETGELPSDPLSGFLPPNLVPPEGDGSVVFTAAPQHFLETGAKIENQAEITFDVNDEIITPKWVNTVDDSAPDSSVLPLPLRQASPVFSVEWAGVDDGSGIRDYTIFVSEDGGPFTPWLRDTTATTASFHGAGGRSYSFFSVARDEVGNVELRPVLPDAETEVEAIAESCVPDQARLCMLGGRFLVEVDWRTAFGTAGQGQALTITPKAGLFYFFEPENLEMLIKIIDACSFSGHFWVFYAATTDVEFTVKVRDLSTGTKREYSNLLGNPAPPVLDTQAFATCP